MKTSPPIDRRLFVQTAGVTAGSLMLGVTLGCSEREGADGGNVRLNAYVLIAPDDTITLINPSAEMGQGVETALPQILADELDARWDQLRIVRAPFDPVYNNPGMALPMQTTAGSTSVRFYYQPLREAGAAARDMLVRAAAARWGVSPGRCFTDEGRVIDATTGNALSYGVLAGDAAKLEPPAAPDLKSSADYGFIGKSMPSPQRDSTADGALDYTIDVMLPGMLYAAVKQCPVFGGRVVSADEAAAMSRPGVRFVIAMDDAVAVVAESWWQAKAALDDMRIDFQGGETDLSSKAIHDSFIEAAETDPGADYKIDGEAQRIIARASDAARATYFMPFLAHMAMEPLSCTVRFTDAGCEVWTGTQNITRSMMNVAESVDLSTERVTLHTPCMGGSFGRRLGQDLEKRALMIAMSAGAPVNVIWPREDSTTHDFYRPAVAASYRAALDSEGMPEALDLRIVSPSFMSADPDEADPGVMSGLDEMPYEIPHVRFAHVKRNYAVPLGTWRSVQRSHAIFIVESLIDELADRAGRDPYLYRRALIKDQPRLTAVLDLAAEKSNWDTPAPGRARGLAVWPCYGSFIAQVVELSTGGGQVRLHRVINAVDCGRIINPNLVRQQIEGGLLQGLTAALKNEITIEGGAVLETNFHDYPMMTMSEMPDVDVHLVDSEEAPGGVGELATPAVQAALTNAIFAATGKRIRTLPVSKHDLSSA